MTNQKKILIVTAHPDDECNGMGGLIIKLAREGHEIQLVVLTDTKWKIDFSYSRLQNAMKFQGLDEKKVEEKNILVGDLRRVETVNATKVTGILEPIFIGEEDAELVNTKKVAANLENILKERGWEDPDVVFTLFPADIHPDHTAASALVTRIFATPNRKTSIVYFEVCSSGRGGGSDVTIRTQTHNFYPAYYFPITQEIFEKRCKMQNCHISQDPSGMCVGSIDQLKNRRAELWSVLNDKKILENIEYAEAYCLDSRTEYLRENISWLEKYLIKTPFTMPRQIGATPTSQIPTQSIFT